MGSARLLLSYIKLNCLSGRTEPRRCDHPPIINGPSNTRRGGGGGGGGGGAVRCAAVRVVQRGVVWLMRGVVVVGVRLVVVHCGGGAAGCGALSQRMAFPWHSGVSFGV